MKRRILSLALVASISAAGCAPLAIGCVVGGTASLVGAKAVLPDHCSGEGCAYSQMLALVLATIGLGLVLGGGIDLAIEHNN